MCTTKMNKKQLKETLANHPYEIWQGKDSRWRTYIPDDTKPNHRKMLVKSNKDVLLDALYNYYQQTSTEKSTAELTLKDIYSEWLEYKRLHTNAETYITRINSDWKTYYLGTPLIDTPISNLTKLNLDVWAHKLIKDYQMTKNQYYNVTVIIRQSLTYAVDMGIIKENLFLQVKIDGKRLFRRAKKKPNETQVFTQAETDEITALAWEDYHNRTKLYELAPLALLFQFQTGIRIGELCVLRYEDIENPDYIHIQRMFRRDSHEIVNHAKTANSDREVFLTTTAKRLLSAARERQQELGVNGNGYIFSINNQPVPPRAISSLYTKYCHKIGTIHKSSHKARKTYISTLIDARVNINTIRETVGHSSERTTLNNYCFDRHTASENASLFENALNPQSVINCNQV